MGSPVSLPINRIVDVEVLIAPQLPAQPTFNQGLIVGPTAVIPAATRVRQYASVAAMLADGYSNANPEVIAAQLYFGQSPPPIVLWIGRQDLTSIQTIQVHAANQGNGYAVGNVLGVTQLGASGGQVMVATIGGGGAVTSVIIVPNAAGTSGTGYSVANGLATTGGSGTGAQVDILSVGDTPLQAWQACRLASPTWYAGMVTSAVKADHLAIAAFTQAMQPVGVYFFTTQDSDVPLGTSGNVLALLTALSYNRTFGMYSTTQSGAFPANQYAIAAAMGVAMGLNTGLPNSYFTMKFKQLIGVATEPLSLTSVNTIEGNDGNLYVSYANVFKISEQGVLANGQFFDEVLNLDMLTSAIQFNVMDLFISVPSVPMTDPGQTQIIHVINQACEDARVRGFIAGGVWEGITILKLSPGDSVPQGYLSQSRPYSQQTASDRALRKAMPVYTAIIEAGAVHSILIGVNVQR